MAITSDNDVRPSVHKSYNKSEKSIKKSDGYILLIFLITAAINKGFLKVDAHAHQQPGEFKRHTAPDD